MQNRALSTCGQRPVLLCYTLFDKFARGQRLPHRQTAAPPRHGMLEERRAYIKQLSHTRFTAGMAPFVIYLKNTITL